ncbi:MAG: hypothetical protein QNJ49_00205 [Mastigocoleus sp. MO_167.B18]|nr:hypothetical protein [Mastigocoleus sp. MO_167.B18]
MNIKANKIELNQDLCTNNINIVIATVESNPKPLEISNECVIQNNLKYIKLINHIATQRKDWSHYDDEEIFNLGWIMNGNNEILNKQKKSKLKERDAKKANKGDRILLCQNHSKYGHRVTHIVEVIDDEVINKPENPRNEDDIWWERKVKVVWMAEKPWEKAPLTKEVIGSRFSFRSGNLVSINAETIDLNLDFLK